MLVIFGMSPKTRDLGLAQRPCRFCGNHAAQRLVQQQNRISFFFIPLIPLGTKYLMTCTACGVTSKIEKSDATALVGPGKVT